MDRHHPSRMLMCTHDDHTKHCARRGWHTKQSPNMAWEVTVDEYHFLISQCIQAEYHPSTYHRLIFLALQKESGLPQLSCMEVGTCHVPCHFFIFPFIFIHSHSSPLFIFIFCYSFSFSVHSLASDSYAHVSRLLSVLGFCASHMS